MQDHLMPTSDPEPNPVWAQTKWSQKRPGHVPSGSERSGWHINPQEVGIDLRLNSPSNGFLRCPLSRRAGP